MRTMVNSRLVQNNVAKKICFGSTRANAISKTLHKAKDQLIESLLKLPWSCSKRECTRRLWNNNFSSSTNFNRRMTQHRLGGSKK